MPKTPKKKGRRGGFMPKARARGGGRRYGRKRTVRRKQGVVSWLTSLIALIIGLFRPFSLLLSGQVGTLMQEGSFGLINPDGSAGSFNLQTGARVYAPMIGGVMFKAISSELTKRARIRTLIPSLS